MFYKIYIIYYLEIDRYTSIYRKREKGEKNEPNQDNESSKERPTLSRKLLLN